MGSWWDEILGYLGFRTELANATWSLRGQNSIESLNVIWDALDDKLRNDPSLQKVYAVRRKEIQTQYQDPQELFEDWIGGALDEWLEKVEEYSKADPSQAKANLSKLSAHVVEVAAASAAIDVSLGMWPGSAGAASSANTKQLLTWLGFGAVLAAVAHDPVKIGLLRPYQDSLEQTFRNRRPDDFGLFQAYRTRELSPTKIGDLSKLDDKGMDAIEAENDAIYSAEISKWGYSEAYAGALSRSATITLNFSQLTALARQGLLNRGLAIYSLWGQGLDRAVMKPALDALMKQNEMASYEGFRSLMEPSYVEGDIPEADLLAYWDRIAVPKDVQGWVLPRLKKRREAYRLKQASSTAQKEKDLTVSQITQAYQADLIKRVDAQNTILALGYSLDEVKILLDLADTRKKTSASAALKRLPLSDYEKAYKSKLISAAAVLQRMEGEYDPRDIALEKQLLEVGKA
jgi:hypothetical protein